MPGYGVGVGDGVRELDLFGARRDVRRRERQGVVEIVDRVVGLVGLRRQRNDRRHHVFAALAGHAAEAPPERLGPEERGGDGERLVAVEVIDAEPERVGEQRAKLQLGVRVVVEAPRELAKVLVQASAPRYAASAPGFTASASSGPKRSLKRRSSSCSIIAFASAPAVAAGALESTVASAALPQLAGVVGAVRRRSSQFARHRARSASQGFDGPLGASAEITVVADAAVGADPRAQAPSAMSVATNPCGFIRAGEIPQSPAGVHAPDTARGPCETGGARDLAPPIPWSSPPRPPSPSFESASAG